MAGIETVAIIGAGTMGAGIAITTVTAGLPTVLIDRSQDAVDHARTRLGSYLHRQAEKGRIGRSDATEASARLRTGTTLAAASAGDLVIEAVFERLDIKTSLLSELEPLVSRDCLIATNTSCLRVSQIAQALVHRDRFLGLHYFSPAEINPLVEVVRGEETAPSTIERVGDFLTATGRIALQCRDSHGFVVNRFFCPYVNEAVRCLEDGLGSPAQIDRIACTLFGQPLGPFATTNIIGTPVMLHALENLAHLGKLYSPARKLRELAAVNGKWVINETMPELNGKMAEAIAHRLRAAVYKPIRELLAEDVAKPEDVDLGALHALRFAIPPVREMQREAAERQARIVDMMCRYGGV